MDDDNRMISDLHKAGSNYLREYAYNHGKDIWKFMKKHEIGESEWGAIMDAAAKGKKIIAHRLYGHHPIYDFPIDKPIKILDFIEHELSDLFTKQGLPILPGELVENTCLLKYCNRLSKNWNFVNGFDVLAGTLAIYQGSINLKQAWNMNNSLETFEEVAHEVGVGAIELAIALSTCNPFLLIGATLQLTATVRGIFNEGAVILLHRRTNHLTLDFSLAVESIDTSLQRLCIEEEHNSMSIYSSLDNLSMK